MPPLWEPAGASGRRRVRAAVERTLRTADDEPALKADAGAILNNTETKAVRARRARCGLEDVQERELLLRGGGAQAPARVVVLVVDRRVFATPPAASGASMQAQIY